MFVRYRFNVRNLLKVSVLNYKERKERRNLFKKKKGKERDRVLDTWHVIISLQREEKRKSDLVQCSALTSTRPDLDTDSTNINTLTYKIIIIKKKNKSDEMLLARPSTSIES